MTKAVAGPILLAHTLFIFRSPPIRYTTHNFIRTLRKPSRSRYASPLARLGLAGQDSNDVRPSPKGVHLYEADEDNPEKRSKIGLDYGEGKELDELQKYGSDLTKAVQELEDEAKARKQDTQFEVDEDNQMTEDDRLRMEQLLATTVNEMRSSQGLPEAGMPHRIRPDSTMPNSSILFLHKLNEALDAASMDVLDARIRQSLWRYYERGKIYVPNILMLLPDEAWRLLWTSQSEESLDNPNRASHLKTLSQDMATAGRVLTEEQRFARLEGLFWDGKPNEAFEQWETGLHEGDGGKGEYLEMGIRMYSYDRNLERANQLLEVLFNLHPTWDPQILVQVLTAFTGRNLDGDSLHAWRLYQRFKQLKGPNVSIENFDEITLAFLRSNYKDYALAVFRDMMSAGELAESESVFAAVHTRLEAFTSSSTDASEVNSLNLQSLSFLPPKYQNKFFFASWMKRLIGLGEMRAAAQVLELMQERSVRPDAKHVNGLISGWLRTSDKDVHKEAEQIAWAMIQARLDFVHKRRESEINTTKLPSKSVYNADGDGSEAMPSIPIPGRHGDLPPASIETFSILVQWYLRRSMFSNVEHLQDLLQRCEIPMNSYFMNHLLYAERRNRSEQEVWTRFQTMSRTITPDIATFSCLWDCMKTHVDMARKPSLIGKDFYRIGFPKPRELMHQMREWFIDLQGQQRRDALADMDTETYNDIVRSFCLSRDPAGSFVAIHCLKQMFDIGPDQESMKMLVLQIARLNLYKPTTFRQSRRLTASRQTQENVARTAEVLDMITKYRAQGYEHQGIDLERMGKGWQEEEQHRVALQLLYTAVQQMDSEGEQEASINASRIIADASKEIGVDDINIGEAIGLIAWPADVN